MRYIDEDDYRVLVSRKEREDAILRRVDYKTVCAEARNEPDWPKDRQ